VKRKLKTPPCPAAPLFDRCLVLPDPTIDRTPSGLEIPETARAGYANQGFLLFAGLAAMDWLKFHGVKVGDKIVWSKIAGIKYDWQPTGTTQLSQRKELLIINSKDILLCEGTMDRIMSGQLTIAEGTDHTGKKIHHWKERQ
jgi:co-chaperonin GroES (HSP10)